MKNRLSRWIAAMTAGMMITCPIVGNLNIVNAADGNQVLIENELNYIYIDEFDKRGRKYSEHCCFMGRK